jgi:magnesium and cobalt transporter
MDEGSESSFWTAFRKIFGHKHDAPIEDMILEAKDDGELKTDEVSMLLNVLQLEEKQVREIMIPRTDMVCAEENESLSDVAQTIIESGHSRIPLYRRSKDSIIGVVHAKDLMQHILHPEDPAPSLPDIMRSPLFIPDTKNVKQVLLEFQLKKIHMAIALDEYGGTSGVVTLEDVLEEIVGEIEDEYDSPKPDEIQPQEDGTVLISGRTSLDDLQEELNICLDSEQVETIGGFICEQSGRVPRVGEKFLFADKSFTIRDANAKNIRWILVDASGPVEES